jgi:CubicO group peptidase (beta-lactamase class C family)
MELNMKRTTAAAAFLVAITLAAPAFAQIALKPDTANILVWTPEQQSAGYRSIETIYKSEVIRRGPQVHPLPKAARVIAPSWTYAGRTWTVDDYMAAYRVSGVLVLKDGKILLERYGMGRKPDDRWTSFSVAKSITSTLVGAAIRDGKIKGLDAQVADYIPELKGSAYDGVTVRQLLTMSSGVKWNEDYSDPKSDVAQAGWTNPDRVANPLLEYMRKLPRAAEPGTKFNYNTAETDMTGLLVANAVGKPLAQYLSETIWIPYGMERDAVWATDLAGNERAGCCISMTLRDYGRVGLFVLGDGEAAGRQVLPDGWVAQATAKQIDNGLGGYGYFWWIRPDGGYDADGVFGQSITTFRNDRVVIVINSAWPKAVGEELYMARAAFIAAPRAAANGN